MGRIFSLLKIFRRDLIIMLLAAFNKQTPSKVRVLALIACLYVLSPADIVPDAIPFAGVLDDMIIIPAAVYGLKTMLPKSVAISTENKADAILKRGGLIVLTAALVVLFWVGLVFFAFYKLFF